MKGTPLTSTSGLSGLKTDLSDDASVRVAVDAAAGQLGGLDILVNNAGVDAVGTVEDNPDEEWHRVLDARRPLGRLVTADEVAAGMVHLASPAAASVTGTALAVDGGMQGLRLRPAVGA